MLWLVLGLVLFLGLHSVRIVAPRWRLRAIARLGEGPWKGAYSVLSVVGLVLIVWGYGQARAAGSALLWAPPPGLRHAASVLSLAAFVLLAATYVPRNHLRRVVGHPMVIAVALWALAHLLVGGRVHAVVLFAAFLAWALADGWSAARRVDGTAHTPASAKMTALAVGIGALAWLVFARWLHPILIGVPTMA